METLLRILLQMVPAPTPQPVTVGEDEYEELCPPDVINRIVKERAKQ